MKYYHGEEPPPEGEQSPTRSVQTRASEKQPTAVGLDGSKRRRTISASMREFFTFTLAPVAMMDEFPKEKKKADISSLFKHTVFALIK